MYTDRRANLHNKFNIPSRYTEKKNKISKMRYTNRLRVFSVPIRWRLHNYYQIIQIKRVQSSKLLFKIKKKKYIYIYIPLAQYHFHSRTPNHGSVFKRTLRYIPTA